MTNINDYAKFVDSTTSMESTNNSAFQVRVNQLGQLAPDIGWSRLMTSAIGMLAESGEFTEIMKKVLFQGREWNEENRFHMKRELGDVLWYWVQGCIALGYSPEEVMEENIKKLELRYPNGFDIARSEHRQEGDI
jgi:NTP pyrophosphatase (non-canonical NTP hydrolase)